MLCTLYKREMEIFVLGNWIRTVGLVYIGGVKKRDVHTYTNGTNAVRFGREGASVGGASVGGASVAPLREEAVEG